jgi:hypothetical protein
MTQRRTLLIVSGLCCILCPSLGMLAATYYNRIRPPASTLQMTERELHLPADDPEAAQNAALTFRLIWRVEDMGHTDFLTQQPSSTPVSWMTAQKAADLGIRSGRDLRWRSSVPAFLVLEFNGRAYARELKRACRNGESAVCTDVRNLESRLYVIDAGPNANALRQEYPDTAVYAIVGGIVTFATPSGSRLTATIGGMDVETIQSIEPLRSRKTAPSGEMQWYALSQAKSFVAEIAFGRRHELWNESVSFGPHPTAPPADLSVYQEGGETEINPN